MRRAYDSARLLSSQSPSPPPPPASPTGYLLQSRLPRTLPLYGAVHPVTGDVLLSTEAAEARELGYGNPALLGHLAATAPVTGALGPIAVGIPWAWQFGVAVGGS
jgi:hypothetical protein